MSSPAVEAVDTSAITLAKYEQVEMGMTLEQVKGILGDSYEEMSRVEMPNAPVTAVYMWANNTGDNATITFQDDKVSAKAQFGLK